MLDVWENGRPARTMRGAHTHAHNPACGGFGVRTGPCVQEARLRLKAAASPPRLRNRVDEGSGTRATEMVSPVLFNSKMVTGPAFKFVPNAVATVRPGKIIVDDGVMMLGDVPLAASQIKSGPLCPNESPVPVPLAVLVIQGLFGVKPAKLCQ